jgi:spore germination cell wall hydrolase CwlJ-like protein
LTVGLAGLAAATIASPALAQLTPEIPAAGLVARMPGGPALPVDAPPALAPIGGEDRSRAATCLAAAIAYEAGFEPLAGQQAVAEVVLNRARSGPFPRTVCGVVFAGSTRRTGCQFTFTCDGSLRRRLPERVMAGARAVAEAALDGRNPLHVAGAAWYHADYVSPYWAPSLVRVAKIGAHIFYRAPGLGDRQIAASSFTASGEPAIAALAGVAGPAAAAVRATVGAKPPAAEREAAPVFSLWGLAPKR